MHIISIVNQKGGVGKTTLTRNIAAELHRHGKRVLAVDLDAQANLTLYSGIDPVAVQRQDEGMKAVMLSDRSMRDVIRQSNDGFDVAPSCLAFAAVELRIQGHADPNSVLKSALSTVSGRYDVVLLDNAPALGRVVINALVASASVIIPAKTDLFSISGLAFVLQTITSVRSSANPNIEIMGIVPNFFHPRQVADRDALSKIQHHASASDIHVFSPIQEQTSVVRSTFHANSMVSSFPASQFTMATSEIVSAILDQLVSNPVKKRNVQ